MSDDKNKDYALVIGIKSYVGLRPLNSAVKDAVAFAKWLQRKDGGGLTEMGQVDLILGETPYKEWLAKAEPNAGTIQTRLNNLGINRGEKIGRRLYIYFSGHGFTDNADEIAMAMANAGMGYFNNSISLNSFHNLFRQVGYFEQVIFILDCCREQTKYSFTPQSIIDIEYFKKLFEDKNAPAAAGGAAGATGVGGVKVPKVRDLFVLSSAYGEQSYAPTDKEIGERRGLLTKALLEGLEGSAADPMDGSITVGRLREYIEKRVKELAEENDLPQEAQVRDENSDGIIIKAPGSFAPPDQIPVRISIDKKVKGNVTLFNLDKSVVFTAKQIKDKKYILDLQLQKRFAPPYILHSADPPFSLMLDLSNANIGEVYEFSFHQSNK
jgi:hypothetical protein